MNICFFIGAVTSQPNFNFLYDSSNISISSFSLTLNDNTTIQLVGYDNIADYIYQNITVNDVLMIKCTLHSIKNDILIEILSIEKLKK